MTPVERAIHICGSQAELVRRCGGRTKHGHVYLWLTQGVTPKTAPLIEYAVAACVAGDPVAAARQETSGGPVKAEDLCPSVQWQRDAEGNLLGHFTPLSPELHKAARRRRVKARA